ncbi:MAG: hypothetical protein PVJ84_09180, partial [Desulfobacteraceae bacterium]
FFWPFVPLNIIRFNLWYSRLGAPEHQPESAKIVPQSCTDTSSILINVDFIAYPFNEQEMEIRSAAFSSHLAS